MYRAAFRAAFAAATLAAPTQLWAQASATSGQTTASTTIIQPIAIAKDSDLSFGRIVRPSNLAAGTSTIAVSAADGTRSISGGDGVLAGGTVSRAAYTVSGEPGVGFAISLSGTPITLTRAGGTETLSVALVKSAETDTLAAGTGTKVIGVGGSVGVTSATVSGTYNGNFTVTVAYN